MTFLRMKTRRPLPLWIAFSTGALITAPIAWWALRPLPQPDDFGAHVAQQTNSPLLVDDGRTPLPPNALTVTLRDTLVDAPHVQPAPAPPPPRLDLQLIAITGVSDHRAAFVYEPSTGEYLELHGGDVTPGGVELITVAETHVMVRFANREMRLELTP